MLEYNYELRHAFFAPHYSQRTFDVSDLQAFPEWSVRHICPPMHWISLGVSSFGSIRLCSYTHCWRINSLELTIDGLVHIRMGQCNSTLCQSLIPWWMSPHRCWQFRLLRPFPMEQPAVQHKMLPAKFATGDLFSCRGGEMLCSILRGGGGGEGSVTWLLPHLFVFLNLNQYLGIKWWKLVLFYVKHFYQSVQSIRERPSWITVNVWNRMLSVISQCLTQLGWSPCDHILFCGTFRAGPDTEMSLPWYSLFGYSCLRSAWSSAIKFHESHLVLHRPF